MKYRIREERYSWCAHSFIPEQRQNDGLFFHTWVRIGNQNFHTKAEAKNVIDAYIGDLLNVAEMRAQRKTIIHKYP